MMKVQSQPKLRRVTALAKKKMPSDGRGISDYTERVYKASKKNLFVNMCSCLSKNPKYIFYTHKELAHAHI